VGLFHVEAGARIHEVYSYLDKADASDYRSLAALMRKMDALGDYSVPGRLKQWEGLEAKP
jgi:hypothetical protein